MKKFIKIILVTLMMVAPTTNAVFAENNENSVERVKRGIIEPRYVLVPYSKEVVKAYGWWESHPSSIEYGETKNGNYYAGTLWQKSISTPSGSDIKYVTYSGTLHPR